MNKTYLNNLREELYALPQKEKLSYAKNLFKQYKQTKSISGNDSQTLAENIAFAVGAFLNEKTEAEFIEDGIESIITAKIILSKKL